MLNKHRKQIDKIDSQIIKLIKKRLDVAKKIGNYKKKNNLKIQDKKREAQKLKTLEKIAEIRKLDKKHIKEIFKQIIKSSREVQK